MKIEDVKVGQTYWWNDPDDGKCSGFVKVVRVYDKDEGIFYCEKKDGGEVDVMADELEKTFTTVGELIEELKGYDPNMGVELYLACYDRNNYTSIRKDWWKDKLKRGTLVSLDTDGENSDVVRISHCYTTDYCLDDC